MPRAISLALFLITLTTIVNAQIATAKNEIAFVSDTQAPLWMENIYLKGNQNKKATRLIFEDIVKTKPRTVYILGDVVSLGFRNKKWRDMDKYIEACRKEGIEVHAVLGNHDVMRRAAKGEVNFQKRFPDHVRTGYVSIVDSVAIILVNSNFSKLKTEAIVIQQSWYEKMLDAVDKDPAIKATIVTCHHAPYTNSKLVGSSTIVQERFVKPYLKTKKGLLFITGHSHTFEHFKKSGKDFLVIGGGGGLHQPLGIKIEDSSGKYKPMFHYLTVLRSKENLLVLSHFLKDDFSGVDKKYSFSVPIP
ncbi:MAG: metallophosphoesterase [Cyclobacteriaceae bacterium]|nr:metallophosphoesterase [Cyclobacteriaceae bacterium]